MQYTARPTITADVCAHEGVDQSARPRLRSWYRRPFRRVRLSAERRRNYPRRRTARAPRMRSWCRRADAVPFGVRPVPSGCPAVVTIANYPLCCQSGRPSDNNSPMSSGLATTLVHQDDGLAVFCDGATFTRFRPRVS